MKRKPEVLLQDIFKNLKAGLLYHKIGEKKKDVDKLEDLFISKYYNKELFYLTKPFTGLTRKEAAFYLESYLSIKKLRRIRQEDKWEKITFKKGRLFPMKEQEYDKFAIKIYRRNGSPDFKIRRIDKVIFGEPMTTFSNYIDGKSYSNQVIIKRILGAKPSMVFENGKIRTYVHIDRKSEDLLKLKRH